MGIEAQGKMVEQVDRDDKKEDKAANEVVDNVLTSMNIAVVAQKVKVVNEDRCDLKKWVVVVITDRSGWLLELLTEVKGLYCAE